MIKLEEIVGKNSSFGPLVFSNVDVSSLKGTPLQVADIIYGSNFMFDKNGDIVFAKEEVNLFAPGSAITQSGKLEAMYVRYLGQEDLREEIIGGEPVELGNWGRFI